ncbi:hypothetical protein DERF_010692 [Dermatophagoides farinae]|uniref:Uncharacterized protein n=1 Tax=Dermatophagoides farinae TaxID=6954 RepID=A0A922L424_DERFA|nr:hypothetical protein DERF_010692 [Dermatophagoides farinae]
MIDDDDNDEVVELIKCVKLWEKEIMGGGRNGKEEKAIQRNGIFSAVLFIHSNRTGGGSKQRK